LGQPHAPGRVTGFFAHPDDAAFMAGGTLAKWTADGADVSLVVATKGGKGSPDRAQNTADLIAQRSAEERESAALLGVNRVILLDFEDGAVTPDLALREAFVRAIRLLRPDAIVTMDPKAYWFKDSRLNHPDHRAVGEAALAAAFPSARDPLSFPHHLAFEGLNTHRVTEVFLALTATPNVHLDVTATWASKMAAVAAHQSQVADPEGTFRRLEDRHRRTEVGMGDGFVEAFQHIRLAR
jgi:LmbE family N-acetylglucosaminyl deacetylase